VFLFAVLRTTLQLILLINPTANIIRFMSPNRNLDRIDIEIIGLLQKDARISNKSLAEKVGLAPSTCLIRVQSLITSGVFRGFHAELEPQRVGTRLQAIISIRLTKHTRHLLDAFRDHVLTLPEVVQLYHVAGPVDFKVHVWVRDAEHLRDLTMGSFTSRDEVEHIETELIFEHARAAAVPVHNV
jgi:DNA-binding Lrp family transcriptional regulator